MKIAIIGSGISGLTCAHLLHREHEITVYEANDYLGGHTHTVQVEQADRSFNVDTGFIVFNGHTYPGFNKLIDQLKVPWRETVMSFSVQSAHDDLEYAGTNLNTIFAQRRNLLRLGFLCMLAEIMRFNRAGAAYLGSSANGESMEGFLNQLNFSRRFQENYLVRMAAAIWSAEPGIIGQFPARTFLQFFQNHGLLSATGHFYWRTIVGGSAAYVEKLVAPFLDRIRLATPVESIKRNSGNMSVKPFGEPIQRFDRVILACHSDQALRLLGDPSESEREVLGAIPYQKNEVVLHTDTRIMPKNPRAWAAWNYYVAETPPPYPTVTYNMNLLQGLESIKPFLVTLNRSDEIDPDQILRRFVYHHPVFTRESIQAQERVEEIDGVNQTHFCGAYWGNGFHEDGVQSALRVTRKLGADL